MNKKSRATLIAIPVLGLVLLAAWYLQGTNIPVLEPKGPVGRQELNLFITGLLLSLVVVIPVFTLLFAFAWKYRESNTKAKYSPDLDGSRIAETIWWIIPSILILIISILTWNSSHQLDPFKPLASSKPQMTIQVVALDWKWLFIYPEQRIASVNFVQFPKDTPVDFEITADAPMNSFWIPQLGGQIYAMPGMDTNLHLMASQYGTFNGSSANISGSGFAGMAFTAKSSSPDDFNRWVQSVKHSGADLSQQAYDKLAEPSQYNPVTYYASAQPGLYDSVIMKYMPVAGSMSGMGTP
ncbi:MAG TPA: ubiquinol oxidase subunit II [Candidatus Dormibacteraeota bacterium]|nr:ubiquinol oxidase subunit II [Candidatus Dormibacteraeota bacterium]